MNRCQRLTRRILLALAFGLLMPPPGTQAQSAAPLHVGDPLPDSSGQSLSGSPAHLSAGIADKIAIVVFSFSKAGGKDTQLWDRELLKDFGSNRSIAIFTVIMLESAPRLLRGVIVSGIKNDMPAPLHASTIVSYEKELLWKQRLNVADDSHAYVALMGEDGRIRWMNSAAFSDTEYKKLKTMVEEQFQSAKPREVR